MKTQLRSAIGVDIVEISRLRRSSKKWGKHFLSKIYTPRELDYSKSKRFPEQHLAARFAAKEAVFKALGEVEREFVGWKNIEILNNPAGKPYLVWHGLAEKVRKRRGICQAAISLSHTEHYAVATAMLQFKPARLAK